MLWEGCCSRGCHGREGRVGRGSSESPTGLQQVVSQEVVLGTLTVQAEGMRPVRGEAQFHEVDGAGTLEMYETELLEKGGPRDQGMPGRSGSPRGKGLG